MRAASRQACLDRVHAIAPIDPPTGQDLAICEFEAFHRWRRMFPSFMAKAQLGNTIVMVTAGTARRHLALAAF
jgi:hypothetical protein